MSATRELEKVLPDDFAQRRGTGRMCILRQRIVSVNRRVDSTATGDAGAFIDVSMSTESRFSGQCSRPVDNSCSRSATDSSSCVAAYRKLASATLLLRAKRPDR